MRRIKVSVGLLVTFVLFTLQVVGQKAADAPKPDAAGNLSVVTTPSAPPEAVRPGFDSITGADARALLGFISADALEGREATTPGYQTASEFVAAMFSLWGIQPAIPTETERSERPAAANGEAAPAGTFFQNVPLREITRVDGRVTVEWEAGPQRRTITFQPDVDYTQRGVDESGTLTAPVVFVGYGITEESLGFDEYKDVDPRGKIVMMLTDTPRADDPASPFRQGDLKDKYYPRRMRRAASPKTGLAREKGAIAILLVSNSTSTPDVADRVLAGRKVDDSKPIFDGSRRNLHLLEAGGDMPWEGIPTLTISRQMADEILGLDGQSVEKLKAEIEKDLKPASRQLDGLRLSLENTVESHLTHSRNVIGYIEGSDPELKKEVVVIGAHLDHLGRKGDYIFNGADDNGSGSVAVMSIARAFSRNPVKPKRSVVFALWTGEEQGLLGSRYYISHPLFPLDKTVACLNLDMVSRQWSKERLEQVSRRWGLNVPEEVMSRIQVENFMLLSHSETDAMSRALRDNNEFVGMSVYLRPTKSAMGGSDYAPFAMKKIPWVFFFGAMTEDYHQPTDSIEKISPQLLEKAARLAYLTAFTLAGH